VELAATTFVGLSQAGIDIVAHNKTNAWAKRKEEGNLHDWLIVG
jgi:hypothetical protein